MNTSSVSNNVRPQGLHLDSLDESSTFKMAHRQMRPSGMHFSTTQKGTSDSPHDTVDDDTVSTCSSSNFSENDSLDDQDFSTNGSEDSTDSSWEDRAVAMERTAVSDLFGVGSRETIHAGGRWSYRAPRRCRKLGDASWIKK